MDEEEKHEGSNYEDEEESEAESEATGWPMQSSWILPVELHKEKKSVKYRQIKGTAMSSKTKVKGTKQTWFVVNTRHCKNERETL